MANNLHMQKDDLDLRYSILDLRGCGAFGNVHIYGIKDEHQNTDFRKRVAVKSIRDEDEKSATREIANLERLANQPHIVSLLGYTTQPYQIYLECCNTDLENYAKQKQFGFNEGDVFKIQKDILKGLQSLIKFGVIHRDIKPANLLVDFNGSDGTRVKDIGVKLCDFGCSRAINRQRMARGDLSELTKNLGTNGFMAPEIAFLFENQGKYTTKVDVWSSAASVLYLASEGAKPLTEAFLTELQNNISSNAWKDKAIKAKIFELVPDSFPNVRRILLEVLKWSPEERTTPDETLALVEVFETQEAPAITNVPEDIKTPQAIQIPDKKDEDLERIMERNTSPEIHSKTNFIMEKNSSPEIHNKSGKKTWIVRGIGIFISLLLITAGIPIFIKLSLKSDTMIPEDNVTTDNDRTLDPGTIDESGGAIAAAVAPELISKGFELVVDDTAGSNLKVWRKGGDRIDESKCWSDGAGACPNGNCHDFDGIRGMVVKETTWTASWYCRVVLSRPIARRLICCPFI